MRARGDTRPPGSPDRSLERRLPLLGVTSVLSIIGFGAGIVVFLVVILATHQIRTAAAFALSIGVLIAGMDPRFWFSAAVVFLLLVPVVSWVGTASAAEALARVAFLQLALGIALELRQSLLLRITETTRLPLERDDPQQAVRAREAPRQPGSTVERRSDTFAVPALRRAEFRSRHRGTKRGVTAFVFRPEHPPWLRLLLTAVLLPVLVSSDILERSWPQAVRAAAVGGVWLLVLGTALFLRDQYGSPDTQPTTTSQVSEECSNSVFFASAHQHDSGSQTLVARTFEQCATVDEWLSAMRLHPEVIGRSDVSEVVASDARQMCNTGRGAPDSRVCLDVSERGNLSSR